MVFFRRLDWILNSTILFLAVASLTALLSSAKNLFYQQLIWYSVGLLVLIMVSRLDWRPLINYGWLIKSLYGLAILLLILTYFFAPEVRGVRGWLTLGSFQFQASEFAKLALIIILSWFWSKAHIQIAHLPNLLISFIYFVIPAILVLLQPDAGTTLVMFGIWFGYLLVSGIKWKHLLTAFLIFAALGVAWWFYLMADYQKERIAGLFYPEQDPLGVNYSVIQSKIAIGSAGLLGKGFRRGTQVQLGFLPEAETDFILPAFIEEWGLIGGGLVLVVFLILLIRIIQIGMRSENNFSRMFCLGAVMMFILHLVLNAGSALGLLPVVGVPFPFLSYGGSNLLTSLVMVGIIQSIIVQSKF